ncbi:exonuclease domain-containing protein, partial [Lutibacter sp. B2]|nr:exonuclease domain-containing protein [Lutibacter sp. B2]
DLNPIVRRKTKITMKDLKDGVTFETAIRQLKEWINDKEYVLCVWSDNDIREIKRNCQYHKMDDTWIDNYLDIQIEASNFFELPKGKQMGLKNAIERLDMKVDKRLHRALVDAYYTGKVFREIRKG